MSSNNPTRRPRNIYDRIIDALEQGEKTFIQNLKVFGTDSSVTLGGLGGGSGSGGGNPGNGAFLPLAGGSMSGPIAYGPKSASTSIDGSLRGHFNVSKDKGKFTSNIIINASPSNWNLSFIDGDYWDGQILRIHVPATEVLVLFNDGNIQLPPGLTSLKIAGPIYFEVMFDSTVSPNGNTGGWELLNPTFSLNGCQVATKCDIANALATAGFNQLSATETLFENAFVTLTGMFDANPIAGETISEVSAGIVFTKSLVIFPTSGPVGTVVTCTVYDFVPGQTVLIDFDGVNQATTPPSPIAPANVPGSIITHEANVTFTFVVPASGTGAKTVHAHDTGFAADVADATFTVTP